MTHELKGFEKALETLKAVEVLAVETLIALQREYRFDLPPILNIRPLKTRLKEEGIHGRWIHEGDGHYVLAVNLWRAQGEEEKECGQCAPFDGCVTCLTDTIYHEVAHIAQHLLGVPMIGTNQHTALHREMMRHLKKILVKRSEGAMKYKLGGAR